MNDKMKPAFNFSPTGHEVVDQLLDSVSAACFQYSKSGDPCLTDGLVQTPHPSSMNLTPVEMIQRNANFLALELMAGSDIDPAPNRDEVALRMMALIKRTDFDIFEVSQYRVEDLMAARAYSMADALLSARE